MAVTATPSEVSSDSATIRTNRVATVSRRVLVYLFLVVVAVVIFLPSYLVLVNALKPFSEVNPASMWNAPTSGISFESFQRGWLAIELNMVASAKVTIPAAIVSSLLGSINGYVFAKWRFRYSNIIFLLVLFGLFLPYQGILIPLVLTLRQLKLPCLLLEGNFGDPFSLCTFYGTIPGLILTHTIFGIPITALIFRAYFVSVPTDLIEAARVDGAGFFGVYRHIMFPIAAPAFAVVLIWQFTQIWNDFLLALTILNDPRDAPVMVGIVNTANSFFVEYNVQFAAALIASLPTLLFYFLLGRLFMRGLLAGAVKG
jgi:glucose/mannose transport system permease protein